MAVYVTMYHVCMYVCSMWYMNVPSEVHIYDVHIHVYIICVHVYIHTCVYYTHMYDVCSMYMYDVVLM